MHIRCDFVKSISSPVEYINNNNAHEKSRTIFCCGHHTQSPTYILYSFVAIIPLLNWIKGTVITFNSSSAHTSAYTAQKVDASFVRNAMRMRMIKESGKNSGYHRVRDPFVFGSSGVQWLHSPYNEYNTHINRHKHTQHRTAARPQRFCWMEICLTLLR